MFESFDIIELAKSLFTKEFGIVMVLTYMLCEALLLAFPKGSIFKPIAAIVVGSLVGYLVIPVDTIPNYISGAIAGGLTTSLVAKFKNNA